MADSDDTDEWVSVGEALSQSGVFLADDTRFARSIRSLAVLLADPDLPDVAMDIIRDLAVAFNRVADDQAHSRES